MNRVEKLRQNRASYSIKLQEFLRISSKRPDAYCVFFEGADSKYYTPRIDLICERISWHGINSGGKQNTLKLFDIISTNKSHSQTKTIFFIDRDFDESEDLPKDRRVYITPCYSIENLYANEAAFRRILANEFSASEFTEHDDSFERCLTAFRKSLSAFTSAVAELNGWILLQRLQEKNTPGSTKVNLGSITLSKIARVDLDSTTGSYSLEEIEHSTGATFKVKSDEALSAVAAIPHEERHTRFRGKFQAMFLRTYLAKLKEDATRETPQLFSSKRPVHLNCSDKNLISELSQYATTPECLRAFLALIDRQTIQSSE